MAESLEVVKVEFDVERKLLCRHRYMREAVRASGKSITELVNDPFGGYPYLVQALLAARWKDDKPLTIDKASDLIDDYVDKHKSLDGLTKALIKALSSYLHIEVTATDDDDDAVTEGKAATPGEPGPSAG